MIGLRGSRLFFSFKLRMKDLIRRPLRYLLSDAVAEGVRRAAKDMTLQANLRVAQESWAFVVQEMGGAVAYPDRYALLDAALSRVDAALDGMYCEFGVHRGNSVNYIASRVDRVVHGFDSFEGLPENWRPGLSAGAFAVKRPPRVRSNVRLYKGWFKDTLPQFQNAHPEPFAFLHLDADLYASTKEVLDILGDRIVKGTVIQFDELLNYPGWREGELKAFEEFCQARSAEVEYLGYVPGHEQVAVRIANIA